MTDNTARRELIVKVWDAAWDRGEVDAFDTLLGPHYQRHGTHGPLRTARRSRPPSCRRVPPSPI